MISTSEAEDELMEMWVEMDMKVRKPSHSSNGRVDHCPSCRKFVTNRSAACAHCGYDRDRGYTS